MKTVFLMALGFGIGINSYGSELNLGEVVDFHIIHGTGTGSWNTPDTRVSVKVGQTLKFHNDDEVAHQLHTNGAPCSHGPKMAPGATWDCVVSKAYNEATHGALYEHNVGNTARFYLIAE